MAIRWKPGELDALNAEIRAYNRKIKALQRAGTDLGLGSLPSRITQRNIKGLTSRAELNDIKRRTREFLKPGSEQLVTTKGGITIPKYERAEINALNARINAQRRKDWDRAQKARAAGDLPLMGRIRDNAAKPRRSLAAVKPADYQQYKRVTLNVGAPGYADRKKQQYYENYKAMIKNIFGGGTQKGTKASRSILWRIARIPRDEFIKATLDIEPISMSFGSPPAKGKDPTAELMIKALKEAFPRQFRTFDDSLLDDIEPAPDDEFDDEFDFEDY